MKKSLRIVLLIVIVVLLLSGCNKKKTVAIDEMELNYLCQLSTIECKVHMFCEGDKDRKFLFIKTGTDKYIFEYEAKFNVGVDFKSVEMDVLNPNHAIVTISKPYLLSDVEVIDESLSNEIICYDNKTHIKSQNVKLTADERSDTLKEALQEVTEYVKENQTNFSNAEANARSLITNYIKNIGEANGTEYTVSFKYAE